MSEELIKQLISIGGSVITTALAAWLKSWFERRKAAAAELAAAKRKPATD